jgi:ACS family glucarate transporter-like MFS transporter
VDTNSSQPTMVRYKIVAILVIFSLFCYLLRMNISVAQQFMAPELGLNDIQVGEIFSSFMLGYALFQVPTGVWGDHSGPRFVLTVAMLSWGCLTLLTGLIPGLVVRGTSAAFQSLIIVRFMLGVAEAAMYPVAARVVANWMPIAEHAFSNAVIIAGNTVGSAVTPPLIAYLMQNLGWRSSFYLTGIIPFGIALLCWFEVRDHPEQHPKVNRKEIALIAGRQKAPSATSIGPSWWLLWKNWNIVFLCISYFLDSYVMFVFVFWLYKYFVDVRKFTVMGGGWALSLPFILATIALPSMGYLSDCLAGRWGAVPGRRAVAMGCLVFCGIMLLAGARVTGPWMAVAFISLSVAGLFSTEGPYWSTVIRLGGPHLGAAGGLMNMVGNLGGTVSTLVMPLLVNFFGWIGALAWASVAAFIAAAAFLLVRPEAEMPSEEVSP